MYICALGKPSKDFSGKVAIEPVTETRVADRKCVSKGQHFRRWQQFLRYLVTHGYAYVHIVRTFEELANALTKIENRHAYITFRKIAMNIP